MASFFNVAQSETIVKKAKLYTLDEIKAAREQKELAYPETFLSVYDGTSVKYPYQAAKNLSAGMFSPLFKLYEEGRGRWIYFYEGIPLLRKELVETFSSSLPNGKDYPDVGFSYYIEASGGAGGNGARGSSGTRGNSYTSGSSSIKGGNGGTGGSGGISYQYASVYRPHPVSGEHLSYLLATGGCAGGGGGGGAGGAGGTASSSAESGGAGGAGGAGYQGRVVYMFSESPYNGFYVNISRGNSGTSGSDGKGYESYSNQPWNYKGGKGGASSDGIAGVAGTEGSGGAGGKGGNAASYTWPLISEKGTYKGTTTTVGAYVKVYKYVPVGIK